jgi:hypothetical protein
MRNGWEETSAMAEQWEIVPRWMCHEHQLSQTGEWTQAEARSG